MDEPQDDRAPVLLDRPAEGMAGLTQKRPQAHHALNSVLRQVMAHAFDARALAPAQTISSRPPRTLRPIGH